MIKFGSARIDENGKATGGKAGDQTGKEVSEQGFYMHSKGGLCFRPKSVSVANDLALVMHDACANNNIGYDQSNRQIMTMLKKYGSTAKIKTVDFGPQPLTCPPAPQWVGTMSGREG